MPVFKIAYRDRVNPESTGYNENIVQNFVATSTRHFPTLRRESKIHLLLHLPEHMRMFGLTSCYNNERFVDFHVKILRFYPKM